MCACWNLLGWAIGWGLFSTLERARVQVEIQAQLHLCKAICDKFSDEKLVGHNIQCLLSAL